MKKEKLISLLLPGVMAVAMFAGCGKQKEIRPFDKRLESVCGMLLYRVCLSRGDCPAYDTNGIY